MDKSHNLITSVAFCFIVLLVGTMSREVKAQDTNPPSMNSPNKAQNTSVTPSGVVLIDKKVGFPIVINQPGSFSLKSNLTVPANTNGIVIAADNVTLDLNGFSITGNGSGDGITDNGVSHLAIAIRNGTITNFNNGINLSNSPQSDVEQIRVYNNRTWGIEVGANSTVSRNIASKNGGLGGTFGGILIFGDNSTVSGNTASGNVGEGIHIIGGNSTVSGNTASGNGNGGIDFSVSGGNVISGNTASGNNEVGIFIGDGNSTVSGNTAFGNSDRGILIGENSTVSGNTASKNSIAGIRVNCPSNIIGNTALNNEGVNIDTAGAGCTFTNNNPTP